MTLVNLRLESQGGTGTYKVEIVGGTDSPLDLADKEVLARLTRHGSLDATGLATVELDPTEDLTPSGLVYRVTLRATAAPTPETLGIAGFTGAGPVEATDWITDLPGALDPTGLAVERAQRIAGDDALQAEIDGLVVGAGGVPLPAVAPTVGQVLAAIDDSPLTTDWVDAAAGEVSQQDLTDHATAEATARGVAIAAAIAALVDTAPGTLNTLNELAAALGDDPNFAATLTALIGTKQPGDATLTDLAGEPTAAFGIGLLALANLAALRTLLGPTGTPSAATYLRGDGSWSTPAGGDGDTSQGMAIVAYSTTVGLVRPTGWGGVLWKGPTHPSAVFVEATDIWVEYAPGGAATVTPSTVAAAAGVGTPTVSGSSGATITPSAVAAVAGVGAPTVTTSSGATVTPSTVAAVAAAPSPSVTAGGSASAAPATVAAVAGVGSPTITTTSSATVTPAAVAAVAAVPAPTVTTGGGATNVTPSHVHQEFNTTDATSFTSAAVALPANQVSLLFISATGGGTAAPTTVTQSGATWVLVRSIISGSNTSPSVHLYRCAPGSAVNATITADFGAVTKTVCVFRVVTCADSNPGSNGADGIGQHDGVSVTSGSIIGLTLPALAAATSAVIGFLHIPSVSTTPAAATGWTALGTLLSTTTPGERDTAAWKQNDVNPNYTATSGNAQRLIGVEVKAP